MLDSERESEVSGFTFATKNEPLMLAGYGCVRFGKLFISLRGFFLGGSDCYGIEYSETFGCQRTLGFVFWRS